MTVISNKSILAIDLCGPALRFQKFGRRGSMSPTEKFFHKERGKDVLLLLRRMNRKCTKSLKNLSPMIH